MMTDAIEVLGWTLLHFVWQGAAVGVLAATMLLALRRRSANARYLTAVSALGLMLLLPLGTIAWIETTPPVGDVSPIFNTVSMIEIPRTREDGTLALDEPPIKVERIGIDFENPPPADAVPLIPISDMGQTILEDLAEQRSVIGVESFLKPYIPWGVAAWLIGVGVLSLRLFASWWSVQRLRRRATHPASEHWQAMLLRIAERLRVTRPVKLVESVFVEVPTVIGWLKPIILLPASAMTGLTAEQLEALLAHELAHVRRHDYLVNLLQTVVETLLFYHPAVWWLSHRIRIEREHCCDDLAVQVCGNGLTYAKALVALEELRAPRLGLAMSSSGGSLLTRVARLLGRTAPSERRSAWIVGAALLAVVGMIGVAWAMQAEVDADDREYAITLDNGVTVRLLAVCDLTLDEDKNWWRPNGAALREPLKFIQVYGKGSRNIGSGREFALEIEGLPTGQHAQVLVNENGAGGATRFGDGSTSLRSMRVTSNLRAYDGYFAVSHRRADVQVRLTDGDWGPWQRVTPDGQRDLQAIPNELRALYEEVQLKQVHDSGRIDLGWQPRFDVRAQIEVRVVDVDDVIHRERASSSGSATGSELGFTVPRERVQWVEYRLWPMSREVTFQNISLQPGLRTKITIGERRLIAKPSTERSPAPTSTHYLATWSAQMDSQFKGELLTASQATRIHDLPAGQVFVVDADSLRECVQRQLAANDHSIRLFEVLNWLRSSDEVGGFSSRANGYFHLRADPGFDGSATLWGDFALTIGETSGRFAVNGQWQARNTQDGQALASIETSLAFAADVKDRQAVVMALSMPDRRIGLVVAEYVRVPLNRWGEISRARDARHWLATGPEPLLAAVERSAQWVSGVKSPIAKPLPKWTRTLSDGTQVSLLGLTNPVRTPFVWWTADGSPLRFGHGRWSSHKPEEDRLVTLVRIVTPTDTERDRGIDLEWLRDATFGFSERQRILFEQRPDVSGPPGRYILFDANSSTTSHEVAITVQVGEWQTLGEVRAGQPLILDEGRCEVRLNDSRQAKHIWASFTRPQPVDRHLTLVAVSKSGERIRAFNEREEEFAARRPEDRVWHSQPQFRLQTEDLSHFEVESRRTESVRFQDFAVEPKQLALGEGLPAPPAEGRLSDTPTAATDMNEETFGPTQRQGQETRTERAVGQLFGRVRLKTEKALPDLEKVEIPAGKELDESLVFSKDGGLANVFVYLRKPTFKIEPPTEIELAKPFVLIAESGKFWPHAAIVRVGRPVVFENGAAEPMNFRTEPYRNNSFNVLVKMQDRFKVPAFEHSENIPISVKSNIKPWMLSHLLPLDHPFAAVTDDDGRFTIDGLPPGEHEFRVWHERVGWLEKSLKITIKPGEEAKSELEYVPDRLKLTESEVLGWGNRQIEATRVPRAIVPQPAAPKKDDDAKGDGTDASAAKVPQATQPKVETEAQRARRRVVRERAENDINLRFAKKVAELAKAEWEKVLAANRAVPGSVSEFEVSRFKSKYVLALLQIEHAEAEQAAARSQLEDDSIDDPSPDTLELQVHVTKLAVIIAKANAELVKSAVERGVAFLKAEQQESGAWQGTPADGVTALCAVALLQAGVKPDDPAMQKALAYLRKVEPTLSYTVALQTMVFCSASPKEDAKLIRRNVSWLEKAQAIEGPNRGAWSYMANNTKLGDGSCSRFAMLGLHAAKRAGFEVKAETWRNASDYWMTHQKKENHAWSYQPGSGPTPSMTLSGMACLAIVNQHLPQDEQTKLRTEAIERAVPFVEPNAHLLWNSGHGGYALQCLERAAHLNRWQKFGKHELHKLLDEKLIGLQKPEGHWTGVGGSGGGFFADAGEQTPEQKAAAETAKRLQVQSNDLIATSFALMCLTGQPEPKPGAERGSPDQEGDLKGEKPKDGDQQSDAAAVPNESNREEAIHVIERWREATNRLASYEAELNRWEYDYVFNVVKRGEGTFRGQGTDSWRFELRAAKVEPNSGAEQRKHWENGQLISFQIEASKPEVWSRAGSVIAWEDGTLPAGAPSKRLMFQMPAKPPPPDSFWGRLGSHVFAHVARTPWFFPPPKDSPHEIRIKRRDDKELWLDLQPRGDEAAEYQHLTVVLDQQTSLPRGVRLIDSPGTKEVVITYRSPRVEWKKDHEEK